MTKEECIALLNRYAEYNGMGIPNLAGCREAMRMAAELLSHPSLPSDPDEAAEKYTNDSLNNLGAILRVNVSNAFKAGAEWMAWQGETVEGYIAGTNEVAAILAIPRKEHNKGDKVVVQIRKK